MAPIEIRLVPTPGAKPEFLCAVEPIAKEGDLPHLWDSMARLNKVIILEGYTRDPWALDTAATNWTPLPVRSVDGRNKLPGFIKYLRDRQKTCFGRFLMEVNSSNDGNPGNTKRSLTTYVWIISHKQTSSSQLSCRISDIASIPKCPLRPKSAATSTNQKPAPMPAPSKPKKKGFGLLGNLVGAQKRTNHQVVKAKIPSAASRTQPASKPGVDGGFDPALQNTDGGSLAVAEPSDSADAQPLATSGKILADFRHEMEQKMLDFDISPEMSIKIEVKLSDHTKKVRDEDKGKVTMEVLKYIVYEQAEEVNEEWIAHKEAGEFTDEIVVAIYKDEESAPQEVIEEMNRAEIPEEMKAQQRMIEQKRRQDETNARRIQEALQRQALRKMAEASASGDKNNDGLSTLNTEKRDLRTIEEIQNDNAKRRKLG